MADVAGAEAGSVRGPVVGLLLGVPLCLDSGAVVLDLVGNVRLVPAQHRRDQLGDRLDGFEASVGGLDRDARASGEDVVEVKRSFGPGGVVSLHPEVARRSGQRFTEVWPLADQREQLGDQRPVAAQQVLDPRGVQAGLGGDLLATIPDGTVAVGPDQLDRLGT